MRHAKQGCIYYYDDGLYFDPSYGNLAVDGYEEPAAPANIEDDYYEPGQYTSPYAQDSYNNNSQFYGGGGMNSMYNPYGWNYGLSLYMGYSWGYPMYGYDPFYGGGFGYPYFPSYGMGYNPYCPGFGFYPSYGYGGFPYYGGYPNYGYPGYGGYPIYGNDFGGNFSNQPDIIFVSNSGPRGGRNNINPSSPNSNRPTKGGKVASPNQANTAVNNTLSSAGQSSKLRETANRNVKPTTYSRGANNNNLYEKASREPLQVPNTNRVNRNTSTTRSTTTKNTLTRQTNQILNATPATRNYQQRSSTERMNRGGNTNSGRTISRPQNNTLKPSSGGSTRPSSGGASRPSGGATRGGSKK